MTPLEGMAVAISFLAIWLTARRNMLCWPLNLVACALYFSCSSTCGSMPTLALQAVFGLGILYGWIVWRRNRADTGAVVVKPLSRAKAVAGLAVGGLGALAIGWFTSRHTDATCMAGRDAEQLQPDCAILDVAAAPRELAALDRGRYRLCRDVRLQGPVLTSGLYAVMIGLAVIGYRDWSKAMSPD